MSSSTEQTLAEFIARTGLTMDVEWAESNPSMAGDAWSREASHYLCTISNADDETMAVPFSMGAARTDEPDLPTVLDALASDASSVIDSPDWLDWAEEMGYEFDGAESMKTARGTHETIQRQADELKTLLGDDAFEALLYNTERL